MVTVPTTESSWVMPWGSAWEGLYLPVSSTGLRTSQGDSSVAVSKAEMSKLQASRSPVLITSRIQSPLVAVLFTRGKTTPSGQRPRGEFVVV